MRLIRVPRQQRLYAGKPILSSLYLDKGNCECTELWFEIRIRGEDNESIKVLETYHPDTCVVVWAEGV